MHGVVWIAILTLSSSIAAAQPKLCDLNEITQPLGRFGWNAEGTELVDKPIEPAMIPCSCEIDPFLSSITERDPVADAHASFASGEPYFVSTPTLGGTVIFEDPGVLDLEEIPDLPTKRIPGMDEHAVCYERERLEQFAKDYAAQYNTTLARLVNAR
jgi:hypothetical protein